MDEVEKHSYSDLDSLEDQLSRFNEKGYRQMLRETSDELRTEGDEFFAEYLKIVEESPRNQEFKVKTLFRVKTTTYVVVMVFILTHICSLYSAIADCGINNLEETDAAVR